MISNDEQENMQKLSEKLKHLQQRYSEGLLADIEFKQLKSIYLRVKNLRAEIEEVYKRGQN